MPDITKQNWIVKKPIGSLLNQLNQQWVRLQCNATEEDCGPGLAGDCISPNSFLNKYLLIADFWLVDDYLEELLAGCRPGWLTVARCGAVGPLLLEPLPARPLHSTLSFRAAATV